MTRQRSELLRRGNNVLEDLIFLIHCSPNLVYKVSLCIGEGYRNAIVAPTNRSKGSDPLQGGFTVEAQEL
ncbi:hypothetical protein HP439_15350 [Sphingobacterium shayense]|uniref:hypothetical protein n=1 Tax=Sphingobacterium shayense TaxID=626343 RepID=UPI001554742E|nr:hypothetical protein [Sphingobacterium shayense]NQD72101.1 hypothetical protein [Sphingobacterium shayense]